LLTDRVTTADCTSGLPAILKWNPAQPKPTQDADFLPFENCNDGCAVAENVPHTFVPFDARLSALWNDSVAVPKARQLGMFGQPFLKPSAGRPLPSSLGKFIELIETTVSPALEGNELPIANLVRRFEHLNMAVCFFEAIYLHDHDLATVFSPFDIAEGSFCCLLSLRERFLVASKLK